MKVKHREDPRIFDAVQWQEHDDHPAVGQRNYNPTTCEECGKSYLVHGWFGRSERHGHYVHPGDWVLDYGDETWIVSADRFKDEFEELELEGLHAKTANSTGG